MLHFIGQTFIISLLAVCTFSLTDQARSFSRGLPSCAATDSILPEVSIESADKDSLPILNIQTLVVQRDSCVAGKESIPAVTVPTSIVQGDSCAAGKDSIPVVTVPMPIVQGDPCAAGKDSIPVLPDSIQSDTGTTYSYAYADSIALSVPQEMTQNIHALAGYFQRYIQSETDLVRAFYVWISHNLAYRIYDTFRSHNEAYDKDKDIQETLDKREGVCRQYSLLFHTLCEKNGIESHIVYGYNKRNGKILPDPHQWCTACIDGQWYMFDPTWGAGYVENYEFIRRPTDRFFMLRPDSLLRTHMPFDPMWQMSRRPLSYQEFDTGIVDTTLQANFCWEDTLRLYVKQDSLTRLKQVSARMEQYTPSNQLVANEINLSRANIQIFVIQNLIDHYNRAINLLNQASDSINCFIRYRNNIFTPEMPEEDIWQMIVSSEKYIHRADSTVNCIREAPEKYHAQVLELKDEIIDVATRIKKERIFLQLYFDTPPKKRRALFRVNSGLN